MTTRRDPVDQGATAGLADDEPWKGSRLRYATPPRAAPSARCARTRAGAALAHLEGLATTATEVDEDTSALGVGWVRLSEPAARSDADEVGEIVGGERGGDGGGGGGVRRSLGDGGGHRATPA